MAFSVALLLISAFVSAPRAIRIHHLTSINVPCDVCNAKGNLWNAWQHEFKKLGGTGSSSDRSVLYKDWKEKCHNCKAVREYIRSGIKLAMGPACVLVVGHDFVQAMSDQSQCSEFDKHVDANSGLVAFKDRHTGLCLSWKAQHGAPAFAIVPGQQGLAAGPCGQQDVLQTFGVMSGQYCLAQTANHVSGFCLFSNESSAKPFYITILPEFCMTKVYHAAPFDEMNLGENQPLWPVLQSYANRYNMNLNKLRFMVDGERIGSQTPQSLGMESEDVLDVFFEQGTQDAVDYHTLCGQ